MPSGSLKLVAVRRGQKRAKAKQQKPATVGKVEKMIKRDRGRYIEDKTWNEYNSGNVAQLNAVSAGGVITTQSGHWSGSLMSGMLSGTTNGSS